MRHGDKVNNLGRTASHRRAMLANMAKSLIQYKRINTTLAKAKALRIYFEPLVTKAIPKEGQTIEQGTHHRRVVFSYLQSKEAIKELFGPIAEKVGDRAGGYCRIIKTGFRRGDGAEMAMIELVDFNTVYNPNGKKEEAKKKTRRGSKKSISTAPTVGEVTAKAAAAKAAAVVAPVEEAVEVVEEPAAEVVDQVVEATEPAAEEAAAEA